MLDVKLQSRETLPDQVTIRRRSTGLTLIDHARTAGGYTLYAPQTAGGKVFLVDIDGAPAHEWQMPVRPGRDAVILKNGNLGYNGSHDTSLELYPAWNLWHGGDFYEATPEGEIVWRYEDPRHHHDAQWLANGNLLYTAAEAMPKDISSRIVGGDESKDGADGIVQSDVVTEVNRKGEIVWEWRAWEHLRPEDFPVHPIFDRRHWPMINGISQTRDGLVLMSLRVTSGIIAVDKKTGKVVWHVGADTVAQQHTPVETPEGNILVFDNGNIRKGVTSPHSRALEFEPGTGRIVWQYADPCAPSFFSPYMGGAQRLENGNTFICESAFGRLFEVTPDGETVWEYVIPQFAPYPAVVGPYITGEHNSVFRAHRYSASRIGWI